MGASTIPAHTVTAKRQPAACWQSEIPGVSFVFIELSKANLCSTLQTDLVSYQSHSLLPDRRLQAVQGPEELP